MSTVASWIYSLVGCASGDVFSLVTEFYPVDTGQSLHGYSTSGVISIYLPYMYFYKPHLDLTTTHVLFFYYLLLLI